jgi:hypothetical protein
MTQYARPDSDVDNPSSGWTNSAGGAPDNTLYTYIDEASVGSDYVEGTDDNCDGDGFYFTVGLSNVTDPESASGHAMKFYGKVDSAESNTWYKIQLLEGTTVRAQKTISDPDGTSGTGTLYTHNLSTSEANSISNYNDLRIRIYAGDDDCMGVGFSVYQAYFECPDASTPSATTSPAFLLFVD